MNVKEFEKKEKSTAELTVELTPEEFEAAVQKAYMKNRGRISIPGFRKGKAPRKMIENLYGAGVFYEDAIDALAPEALKMGVEEQKLDTVGRPSILDFSVGEDKGLTIKFGVSLYPEVTLGEYKGIAAPKAEVSVSDEDVEKEIESVREQNARIETADREAKNGDTVDIDFEGFTDGVPFEGGKGEHYDLELGSGSFIPGFEDQLVGVKAGDSVDVNVTFPTQYNPALAGKDATFKVTVHEVKEKLLPDLDDEFAKDVSECDTLDEYRQSVRENLTKKREDEAKRDFEDAVLEKLVDGITCDVPDAMVEEHLDNMMENFRYNLSAQGMGLEQYLGFMGMDVPTFREQSRPNALRQIKADLAFEAIAKTEDFPVSDEEVEAEYQRLAGQYKMELDAVKKAITEDAVRTGLKIDAAHKLVFSSAVAEEKAPETEGEAE